jgi:hypothetical protein
VTGCPRPATINHHAEETQVDQTTLSLPKAAAKIKLPTFCRTVGGFTEVMPGEPHWIVMDMSIHKEAPYQLRFKHFFRHATSERAIAEAERLSVTFPGKRYSVYGSGPTYKVEAAPAVAP